MRQGRGYTQHYMVHRGQIVGLDNRADGRGRRWTTGRPFGAFLATAINCPIACSTRAILWCTRGRYAREIYVLDVGLRWTVLDVRKSVSDGCLRPSTVVLFLRFVPSHLVVLSAV